MMKDLQLSRNQRGDITAELSDYKPDKATKELIKIMTSDFAISSQIMSTPYREFNDMTVIERQTLCQKKFNNWQEAQSEDPDLAWKSNAIRPVSRNKVISIAAHLTSSILYPNIYAQNEDQEEDKEAAKVMRMLVEWVNDNYDYAQTFVYSVIAALVNPASIIHLEYCEVMRKIKEIQADGSWTRKEVVDELMSGFISSIVPIDELYIADIYQHDIQKQPWLFRIKAISYDEAKKKYAGQKNLEYVKPGLQIMFDETTDTFYEQYDENLRDRLVYEDIYYNRDEDLEVPFLNRIPIGDIEAPNPRQDKAYPFVKFGFEPIDEGKFFYYKSLVDKTLPDSDVIDVLYQMIIDGTFLQLMPPTAIYGDETINSSVVTPGTVTVLKESSKINKIDVGSNLAAGNNTLAMVENSLNESSQDPRQAGQSTTGSQTAFEVSRLEENARISLGLTGKMISFGVRDYGRLLVDSILQFMTVAEVGEIAGLKYRSFLLPSKTGMQKTKKVIFDPNLPDVSDEEQDLIESYKILEEEGGLKGEKEIYRVNPEIFRRRKFLLRINPESIIQPSETVKKALNLEEYDRAVQNPLSNQEEIFRDLLLGSYDATKNDVDKYVTKPQPAPQNGIQEATGSPLSNVLNAKMGSQKEMAMKTS